MGWKEQRGTVQEEPYLVGLTAEAQKPHDLEQDMVARDIFYVAALPGVENQRRDASRLNKLVREARSVIGVGVKLGFLGAVTEIRMLLKLVSIFNIFQPLYKLLVHKCPFSQRLYPTGVPVGGTEYHS